MIKKIKFLLYNLFSGRLNRKLFFVKILLSTILLVLPPYLTIKLSYLPAESEIRPYLIFATSLLTIIGATCAFFIFYSSTLKRIRDILSSRSNAEVNVVYFIFIILLYSTPNFINIVLILLLLIINSNFSDSTFYIKYLKNLLEKFTLLVISPFKR